MEGAGLGNAENRKAPRKGGLNKHNLNQRKRVQDISCQANRYSWLRRQSKRIHREPCQRFHNRINHRLPPTFEYAHKANPFPLRPNRVKGQSLLIRSPPLSVIATVPPDKLLERFPSYYIATANNNASVSFCYLVFSDSPSGFSGGRSS